MNLARTISMLLFCGMIFQWSSSITFAEDTKKLKIEFRLAQDDPAEGLKEYVLKERGGDKKGTKIYLYPKVELSNKDLKKASKRKEEFGTWGIHLILNKAGGEKMLKFTRANTPKLDGTRKRLAILFDDKLIMAPFIHVAISTEMQISGGFTEQKVDRVVNGLNQGK